jgi:creatinine amidohydrolase/Fe(II)-dependent formamide hydrolase-like protein
MAKDSNSRSKGGVVYEHGGNIIVRNAMRHVEQEWRRCRVRRWWTSRSSRAE